MTELDRIILDRCRELAEGAAPDDVDDGICWDMVQRYNRLNNCSGNIYVSLVHGRLREIFAGLGLDDTDPVGDYFSEGTRGGGHWEWERGQRRRELCGLMADYLESINAGAIA